MTRIGIIGAGRMGSNHAGNLKDLGNAPVGVYDINPEAADAFSKKFGAKIYDSAEAMCSSGEIDLVIITSPTYVHIEGLRAVRKANLPVFCEKPLCRTREQLDEIKTLFADNRKFFALGFVRRCSAGVRKFKAMMDEGVIGRPLCGSISILHGAYARMRDCWFADYDKSGGVMLDMLAHHADLQNYLIGEPESIYAKSFMLNKNTEKPYDYVSATAVFRNGYFSNMECTWMRSGPSGNSMTVYGEKGALSFFDDERGLVLYREGKPSETVPLNEACLQNVQESANGNMYRTEMAELVYDFEHNLAPFASLSDGVAAMTFCLGMMESAETGKEVRF